MFLLFKICIVQEKGFPYCLGIDYRTGSPGFKGVHSGYCDKPAAEEKFSFSDRMLRSSGSIGTQISEGYGCYTVKDQLNFCVVARSSLNETLNHLYDALDEVYIGQSRFNEGMHRFKHVETSSMAVSDTPEGISTAPVNTL